MYWFYNKILWYDVLMLLYFVKTLIITEEKMVHNFKLKVDFYSSKLDLNGTLAV